MRSLLVALALLVLPASAHAADPFTVTTPDGAVYRATESELAHWAQVARRSGSRRGAAAQAFQLLVGHAWIRGEAAERGIVIPWDQVVREFRRQRADSFSTRRQYRRFLREYGQTTDDILFRVHTDMLSDRIREQIVAPVTVTDADVDAHLAEHGKPRVPERRDIRLILTRERSAAVAAKRELLRGATWSSVARRYSIDAATRRTKARLPNVARSWLERRLRRAVFGARPGRIIGPVRTRSGYYVVRVTRIHPGHDIADDVAREGARQTLLSQAQQAALDRFLTEYDAKWRARTACAPRWRSQRQCGG